MKSLAGISEPSRDAYHGLSADEQLVAACAVLTDHATSKSTGCCVKCGSSGPCWRRETAVVVFSRTSRLPTRNPGPSRPTLADAICGHPVR